GRAPSYDVGAREGRARRKATSDPDQPDGLRGDRAVRPGKATGGPGLPGTLRGHRQGLETGPAPGRVRSCGHARPASFVRADQPRRGNAYGRDPGGLRTRERSHDRAVHRDRRTTHGPGHGPDGGLLPRGAVEWTPAVRNGIFPLGGGYYYE